MCAFRLTFRCAFRLTFRLTFRCALSGGMWRAVSVSPKGLPLRGLV